MTVNISKPAINVREKLAELERPSGVAGEAILRSQTVAEQAALLGFQPKNIFINGDQRIWQRGTTQTNIGASTETVVSDRWRNYQSNTTGRCTWSQDTDAPDGHEYSAKLQVTTSDTSVAANHRWNIAYRMETDDFKQMGFGTTYATGFTVQFWVKTNKTGIYSMDAYVNNAKPTCKRNFAIHHADTWTHIILTFPPSDIATGNEPSFWIWLQAGDDYTDDRGETWTSSTDGRAHNQSVNLYDSTNNYIKITGIQMVKGEFSSGLPFERRSYGEELQLCKRYFQKHGIGTLGLSNSGGTTISWGFRFDPEMRAQPAATLNDTTYQYADPFVTLRTSSGSSIQYNGFTQVSGSEVTGGELQVNGASTTANKVQMLYQEDAFFFDAEL